MIAVLQAQLPTLSLRRLCQLLGVSRSWYYAHPTAEARAERDLDLRDAIERVTLDFPGYGYRRVMHALRREGWVINHKPVLRVMRQESLLCHLKRRFLITTDSAHGWPPYPNLLAEVVLSAPNRAWVADITYVRLPKGFVYLACVLDAFSRRCVGWKLSRQIDTQRALDALEMALTRRCPAPELIHHSDRGVQYASLAYVALSGVSHITWSPFRGSGVAAFSASNWTIRASGVMPLRYTCCATLPDLLQADLV